MNQITSFKEETVPFIAEAEQAVLGTLLLHPDSAGFVSAQGGSDLFHDSVHAELFNVISERSRAGLIVSPVALAEWAKSHAADLGGAAYLVNMAGASQSPRLMGSYVDILSELSAKRKMIDAMSRARLSIDEGEDTAERIAGQMEADLLAAMPVKKSGPVSMMAAVTKAVEEAAAAQAGDASQAVQTGIPALDRIMSGMFPGDLVLLGGRPSMGKTAVALSMAMNNARAGHGVVICSLEMNPEAMALRAISEATSRYRNAVMYSTMRTGGMTDPQFTTFQQAAAEVAELPIQFLSRDFSDIGALMSGAKQARRMLGDNMKLFVVDYAQLLTAKAANRYEEITKISIALKSLAGQLGVPVLALSQLSRALEQRVDKRPMMSDLRESGQLEQDADAVMFCYRDEYYLEREEPDIHEEEKHDAWQAAMDAKRNHLEIIVAKQRQGAVGTAHVRCNPALNLIWEG